MESRLFLAILKGRYLSDTAEIAIIKGLTYIGIYSNLVVRGLSFTEGKGMTLSEMERESLQPQQYMNNSTLFFATKRFHS